MDENRIHYEKSEMESALQIAIANMQIEILEEALVALYEYIEWNELPEDITVVCPSCGFGAYFKEDIGHEGGCPVGVAKKLKEICAKDGN